MCYDDSLAAGHVKEVIGIPGGMWANGKKLRQMNCSCAKQDIKCCIPHSEHADKMPWDKVYEWFHSPECSKVDINKQTKRQYVRSVKSESHT